MKKAANYLANESVLFIATNSDFRVPTGDGIVVPGKEFVLGVVLDASQDGTMERMTR